MAKRLLALILTISLFLTYMAVSAGSSCLSAFQFPALTAIYVKSNEIVRIRARSLLAIQTSFKQYRIIVSKCLLLRNRDL